MRIAQRSVSRPVSKGGHSASWGRCGASAGRRIGEHGVERQTSGGGRCPSLVYDGGIVGCEEYGPDAVARLRRRSLLLRRMLERRLAPAWRVRGTSTRQRANTDAPWSPPAPRGTSRRAGRECREAAAALAAGPPPPRGGRRGAASRRLAGANAWVATSIRFGAHVTRRCKNARKELRDKPKAPLSRIRRRWRVDTDLLERRGLERRHAA